MQIMGYILRYLTLVSIHTPTEDMTKFKCPQQGRVESYNILLNQYKVQMVCPKGVYLIEWFRRSNLMPLSEK